MKHWVSLGGGNDIGFWAVYSIDRIKQSSDRWTGSQSVPKAIRQLCRYWASWLTKTECVEMIRERLQKVYIAAQEPILTASVYPVQGPRARVGGQTFLRDSSVEVWCGHLDPTDTATFAGTVAHELAHLHEEEEHGRN